jgi:hypothetical protein
MIYIVVTEENILLSHVRNISYQFKLIFKFWKQV